MYTAAVYHSVIQTDTARAPAHNKGTEMNEDNSLKPPLVVIITTAASLTAVAFRQFGKLVVVLAGFAAQRPRTAGVMAVAALLLIAGANVVQARRAAARRAEAMAAAASAKSMDAYRRYQDYEYVKRVGPITGPWYSNKW